MSSPISSILRRSAAPRCRLSALNSAPATSRRSWTTLTRGEDALTVHALNATLPYVWLRDACPSPACVHPGTRQKLHRTSDIPADIAPRAGADAVRVTPAGLEVAWADGHASVYPREYLERYADPVRLARFHRDDSVRPRAWARAGVAASPELFVSYADVQTPVGLVRAMEQLARYGLLFVRGVPPEKTANAECELRALAARFGELRTTFYGTLWDVVSLRESRNIAYTNLDLGLHMDLLYFEHPPRYQILHCLRNRVVGGTSVFVDALHAAQTLRAMDPVDFEVLTTTPVEFHYVNDGHHLHRSHPTIELTPSGEISHINYSPPFQAPLALDTPKAFYGALKRFADLLNDPANTYEYTLNEGDAVLFDNRRVLHARTAFSDKEGAECGAEGEPTRWLKGCYLEADDLLDRMRVLRTKLDGEAPQ